MSAVERERALRRQLDELRFQAPNPRDFRTWDEFYAAQAAHGEKMAELEREIDAVIAESWGS